MKPLSGKIIFPEFLSNEKWNGPISDSSVGDRLKFVTQFVDTETDFQSLLKENFDLDGGPGKERIGMIGLHTCGNLAPDSLRQAYFCAPSCFLYYRHGHVMSLCGWSWPWPRQKERRTCLLNSQFLWVHFKWNVAQWNSECIKKLANATEVRMPFV